MLPTFNFPAVQIVNGSPAQATASRIRTRVALVVTADSSLRERLRSSLTGLRWQVLEAPGGAQAWIAAEAASQLEALLVDPWLPDLNVVEFLEEFHRDNPQVALLMTDGTTAGNSPRSHYHQELLYAIRRSQEGDTAAWNNALAMGEELEGQGMPGRQQSTMSGAAGGSTTDGGIGRTVPGARVDGNAAYAEGQRVMPAAIRSAGPLSSDGRARELGGPEQASVEGVSSRREVGVKSPDLARVEMPSQDQPVALKGYQPEGKLVGMQTVVQAAAPVRERGKVEPIPELIGGGGCMLEVSRRIRLVAARTTPVLIEGPTGSGKELVAEALHRLSTRARKPFVAINCAAIPETLLESELFGHTRGAFTGAVQGRIGRIESADGGTLFLDEIGEMPLALQSKLLRFFESGELQRIGDNETVKVDVRIVAATHQPLAECAQKGTFRADLYYRLAVFLIRTPSLMEHVEDLPQLVSHFMGRMGRTSPVKSVEVGAMWKLQSHNWPGNVRELEHVLERAAILAGDDPLITAEEIDFGLVHLN